MLWDYPVKGSPENYCRIQLAILTYELYQTVTRRPSHMSQASTRTDRLTALRNQLKYATFFIRISIFCWISLFLTCWRFQLQIMRFYFLRPFERHVKNEIFRLQPKNLSAVCIKFDTTANEKQWGFCCCCTAKSKHEFQSQVATYKKCSLLSSLRFF